MISNLVIFLATFFFMEFVANFTHRFVMHGFMWYFHEDHHRKTPGFFEKNDIFFIIFALPSILLINIGVFLDYPSLLSIGLGILAYGIGYFLVHEVLIHRRFKFLDRFRNPYFEGLIAAHQEHHSKTSKEGCTNFGMLYVPIKFFKDAQ